MKADLAIWEQFLQDFNGRSFMLEKNWVDSASLHLYTDAAGSVGFGACFQNHWVYGHWPEHWKVTSPDITFKELFPIVLAVHLWAAEFVNRKIIIYCDNKAVVEIINKQSTRSIPSMHLLRLLVLQCLQYNVLLRAKHIPGVHNNAADALSRGQIHKFRALVPQADTHPAAIPATLQRLFQLK